MERESAYTRWIFNKALNTKLEQLKETAEVTHSVYDKLIFSKIKEIIGGRVRFFITGGAPIS